MVGMCGKKVLMAILLLNGYDVSNRKQKEENMAKRKRKGLATHQRKKKKREAKKNEINNVK